MSTWSPFPEEVQAHLEAAKEDNITELLKRDTDLFSPLPDCIVPKASILRYARQDGGEIIVAFMRKKRVGPYEYHQLVENRWIDGKPRQRVLLHLGRYASVEAALEGWPKEVEGLHRFASQQWDKADRLKKEEPSFEWTLETLVGRARKAEKLADEIEAKLKKLQDLRDQGKV
jgi:hypothetical protein